jgi:trk system potassium uptake protein TrkA
MKQILVVGAGRFGSSIAHNLNKMGHEVMVVDRNEDIINELSEESIYSMQGNATNESTIKAIGVSNFDTCVIAISDIQTSILIGILLKEAGAERIVAKAQSDLHAKVLYRIGIDKVVFPERDMGMKVAQSLVSKNIMDYIELSENTSIVEVIALDEWVGKTLVELNMRVQYGLNVIAIKNGEDINISPLADAKIKKNDVLFVLGTKKDLNKINKKL